MGKYFSEKDEKRLSAALTALRSMDERPMAIDRAIDFLQASERSEKNGDYCAESYGNIYGVIQDQEMKIIALSNSLIFAESKLHTVSNELNRRKERDYTWEWEVKKRDHKITLLKDRISDQKDVIVRLSEELERKWWKFW